MALRTSGHLLLGVVRIYSRKAKYLLADCNEAFVKIKMAFRPGAIDLPTVGTAASIGDLYDPLSKDGATFLLGGMPSSTSLTTLTLPHVFHQFDTALSDLNDLDYGSLNQAREDEITLKEDFSIHFGNDGFGVMPDFGADDFSIPADGQFDHHDVIMMDEEMDVLSSQIIKGVGMKSYDINKKQNMDVNTMDVESLTSSSMIDDVFRREGDRTEVSGGITFPKDGLGADDLLMDEHSQSMLESFYDKPLRDDGFGASTTSGGLLGDGFIGDDGLFDEAPLSVTSLPDVGDDDDLDDTIHPLMNNEEGGVSTALATVDGSGMDQASILFQSVISNSNVAALATPQGQVLGAAYNNNTSGTFNLGSSFDQREVFALEPLDMTAISGDTNKTRGGPKDVSGFDGPTSGKKLSTQQGVNVGSGGSGGLVLPPSSSGGRRKLIIDAQKGLDGDEMRRQLADSSDLVTDLNLAPPSKRLMQWKETGGCNKLLVKNLRGFGCLTRSKSPARVLFYNAPLPAHYSAMSGTGLSDRDCLTKLVNLNINSASKAITDMITRAVPSLNLTSVDDEESIYYNGPSSVSSHHRLSPHKFFSKGKLTPGTIGNETPPQNNADYTRSSFDATPHKRVKLDTIVESPNLKFNDDYGDEDSHLSPGGYVDEGDDDIYNNTTLTNGGTAFAKKHLLPPSSVKPSHNITPSNKEDQHQTRIDEIKRLQEQEEAEIMLTDDQIAEVLGNDNGTGETVPDQFAEQVWGKRALLFFSSIQKAFNKLQDKMEDDVLTFDQFVISDQSTRKAVAAKFYSLLVLKKDKVVDLKQDEPYSTIFISKGPKYHECSIY